MANSTRRARLSPSTGVWVPRSCQLTLPSCLPSPLYSHPFSHVGKSGEERGGCRNPWLGSDPEAAVLAGKSLFKNRRACSRHGSSFLFAWHLSVAMAYSFLWGVVLREFCERFLVLSLCPFQWWFYQKGSSEQTCLHGESLVSHPGSVGT